MTKSKCLLVVSLYVFITGSLAEDCGDRADGIVSHSCKFYKSCKNGQEITTVCQGITVFSEEKEACIEPQYVPPPCGDYRDCLLLDDGTYPDPGCHTFYTCTDGIFSGHGMCPGGLVYSTKIHGCDWPDHVDPPCGTQGRGGSWVVG